MIRSSRVIETRGRDSSFRVIEIHDHDIRVLPVRPAALVIIMIIHPTFVMRLRGSLRLNCDSDSDRAAGQAGHRAGTRAVGLATGGDSALSDTIFHPNLNAHWQATILR
eukprot:1921645-Rhodomonas_salina.1